MSSSEPGCLPLQGPTAAWAPWCPSGTDLPGASMVLALHPSDGLPLVLEIEDGETVAFVEGADDLADLRLRAPRARLTEFLTARLPMPELLVTGSIEFDRVTYVSLATGLFESPGNRRAWGALLGQDPHVQPDRPNAVKEQP